MWRQSEKLVSENITQYLCKVSHSLLGRWCYSSSSSPTVSRDSSGIPTVSRDRPFSLTLALPRSLGTAQGFPQSLGTVVLQ